MIISNDNATNKLSLINDKVGGHISSMIHY